MKTHVNLDPSMLLFDILLLPGQTSTTSHCIMRAMLHLTGRRFARGTTYPSTENGVILPFGI